MSYLFPLAFRGRVDRRCDLGMRLVRRHRAVLYMPNDKVISSYPSHLEVFSFIWLNRSVRLLDSSISSAFRRRCRVIDLTRFEGAYVFIYTYLHALSAGRCK